MVYIRYANNIFVEMPEGKRPLGRPRRRWKDNIADLKEEGLVCGLDLSGSRFDRVSSSYATSVSIKGEECPECVYCCLLMQHCFPYN
jgi:hypothetical protein